MASFLPKFFGRTVGEGAGVAIGTATARGIEPPLEQLGNAMRETFPHVALEPDAAAELEARKAIDGYGGVPLAGVDPTKEAAYGGVRQKRFDRMVALAHSFPTFGQLVTLRRRQRPGAPELGIGQAGFRNALRHEGIPTEYIDELEKLVADRLDIAAVANAIQQGFMTDENVLPTATEPDKDWRVAAGTFAIPVEEVDLSPTQEAGDHGIDLKRLKVMAQLVGLPPGEEALLDMWRRGIIDKDGYATGLREGHTKTKWTAALAARFWQRVPAATLVNLRLRGWIDDADYHARMARHGFRPAAADDQFHAHGRPATVRQALIGERRGGSYDGPLTGIPDWFQKAVKQSDVRDEWINLLWHGRETYPSAFVMRRLVGDAAITPAEAADLLFQNAWPRDLADKAAAAWAKEGGDAGTDYVGRARTQLWTTTHRSFIAGESTATQAKTKLGQAGVPVADRDAVIAVWTNERELIRKQLTPAQIKKAWVKVVVNRATGVPWTREDAVAALIERGYSANDANEFLDLPPTGTT